jgi:hypothetical protein
VNGGGSRVRDKGAEYASGWGEQVAATGGRSAGPGARSRAWSRLHEEWAREGKGQLGDGERRGWVGVGWR